MAKKEVYILLHRTGAIAYTNTLDIPTEGLDAIININTLEACIDGVWLEIPEGIDTLEDADELLGEDIEDEDITNFSRGARRVISPERVWKYCKP